MSSDTIPLPSDPIWGSAPAPYWSARSYSYSLRFSDPLGSFSSARVAPPNDWSTQLPHHSAFWITGNPYTQMISDPSRTYYSPSLFSLATSPLLCSSTPLFLRSSAPLFLHSPIPPLPHSPIPLLFRLPVHWPPFLCIGTDPRTLAHSSPLFRPALDFVQAVPSAPLLLLVMTAVTLNLSPSIGPPSEDPHSDVLLPVTTLPAPTKMTRQWVLSIVVSWGYQVYHLNGMQPASDDRVEKLLQDHSNVSGSYNWEGWLKTATPIMKGLHGNMHDPIKHPLDWQCILLESNLSRNPPAPMVESNLASWQLCLETMIKELDKRQPGSSPEVPMEVDPLTIQPSLFKHPHSPDVAKSSQNKRSQLPEVCLQNLHLILINWSPGNIRFHPGVIHPRGQALLAMQPGQPIASGSLSGNVSEPNVPPAPSSNTLSENELWEPIEEGVEM
ncbi:uncharacterized protein EDB91DRAFT_1245467 [Suillus paluster]|uniref:uncharacterized protein n=1 Tax=Suillus paluster TaxID=48578 RepID=UPI001B86D677|nr:uncharacterized protein EDB91DRAFT_1245467 [Suillus paluster]KAG1747029.1 hypothetical protein EDB91DRAFT_1245467 [Suillus paluster]